MWRKKSPSLAPSACSTFQKGNVRSRKQPLVMTRMTAQYLSLVADNTLTQLSWFHPPVPALSLSRSKRVEGAAGS